ncbi:MAG: hypothetical protein ACAH17_00560 [Candidatus Paceibacterota bacterium]
MENFLIPLSFTDRRAPWPSKVRSDASRMYAQARYVITLNNLMQVSEVIHNTKNDGTVVDCLVVLAPFNYQGKYLEKTVVLEIGFRRFVPYAQTNFEKVTPRKRTAGGNMKKRVGAVIPKKKTGPRALAIKPRVPVVGLSEDVLFDLMPVISRGIQVCTDAIVSTWTNTMGATVRWTAAGNEAQRFWIKHEMEPEIQMRIPKEAQLLCAAASFAEMVWRKKEYGNIHASAGAIKDMLKYYIREGRRRGRDAEGNFEDDYVRKGSQFQWVAERLKEKVKRGYTPAMVEGLFDLIGKPDSIARKLIEQVWRVHKVPLAREDPVLDEYQSMYGEMKEVLLERWPLQTYRKLRGEKNKKEWLKKRTSKEPYKPHAVNSHRFTVIASKEAQEVMLKNYCEQRALAAQTDEVAPIQSIPRIAYVPPEEDDDIPWDLPEGKKKTGTDDKIPF